MQDLITLIKDVLTGWGFPGLITPVKWLLFILLGGGGLGLSAGLWKLVKTVFHACRNKRLNKDLHPYFSPVEIEKATEFFVPTKCQNIDPSREQEPGFTHAVATKEKLIDFFLKRGFKYGSSDQRFYIILADSGMGKTTFMINLYLRYISKLWGKEYRIKLLPLGYPSVDSQIEKITEGEKENTILLLDAFDEDNRAAADYKKRMDELVEKTHRFRKVIFTCRTQFFPCQAEEPGETGILKYGGDKGYHTFYKLYISPFDDRDTRKYLGKKYPFYRFKKKSRAFRIVENSPNLMVRPMLLSYIEDLLQGGRRYDFSFQVYEELIARWIERESRRYREERRETFKKELYRFSRAVALDIYSSRGTRQGLTIPAQDMARFAAEHRIDLGQMEMKSRSLLNRDAAGNYKFAHKSILEYFLAREAADDYHFYKDFNFDDMDQAHSFYDEMVDKLKLAAIEFLTGKGLKGKYWAPGLKISGRDLSKLKISELDSIESLDLDNNQLDDISPLQGLKNLRRLWLSNNQIDDISPLQGLKNLTQLWLNGNQIVDISPLLGLKNLTILSLSDNRLSDISPLQSLKNLKELYVNGNQIHRNQVNKLKKKLPGTKIYY